MIQPRVATPNAAIAAHYDDLAPFYLRMWGEHIHHGYWLGGGESHVEAVERLAQVVVDTARLPRGGRAVDIGCGFGGTARRMARQREADVVGVTISAAQVMAAREQTPAALRVDYRLGDWLTIDLPDASFDAAVAIETTQHIGDLDRFIERCRRVLRPGGRVVISTFLATAQRRPWQERHLLEPICRESCLQAIHTAEEHQATLGAHGFDDIEVRDITRHVTRTWTLSMLRSARATVTDREFRSKLFDPTFTNRAFAWTMFRFVAAYRTGALRYAIVSATKR